MKAALWACSWLCVCAVGALGAGGQSTTAARASRVQTAANEAKRAALTPLSDREQVEQLLDRFTFGPRPGDVDRVLGQGADTWLAQQMAPEAINDAACDKRLAQYPTLGMSPAQVLGVFPDRGQVAAVADGKVPFPADPLMNAVFEVQVEKLSQERDGKKPDGSGQARPEPTEAEKAARKQADQATAARLFGELIAMPKNARMGAILAMPVEDRIALTGNGNLAGEQRNLLFNDFSPREREAFQAMSGQVSSSGNIGSELAQGRILRDILTERQLAEVMTDFWFNHFNVFLPKDSDQWYTTSYERDAIRRHALGSFHDLLLATAESPAMMVYLDNWLSIGPDSQANGVNPQNPNAKRGNKGLNENYGREVMELHTVGVNGGYTQADVTALAGILTGWGVDRPQQGGPFAFDPKRHEPGTKVWFGYSIDDQGNATRLGVGGSARAAGGVATAGGSSAQATPDSVKQGLAALDILAAAPQTAHFISSLLAQRFVADAPPPALVDRLSQVYLSSHGDIKTVLRALIASPEFNSRQYFRTKVKTPVEFVASAFRATATDPQNPGALVNTIRQMGMELYHALPPTGYYLTADQWMNSVALVDRLNFAYQLTTNHLANQKFDAPRLLAIGMMMPGAAAAGPAGHVTARPVSASDSGSSGSVGQETALHVLENTIVDAPVSSKTNELIDAQMGKQPANASPTDTLNVLTALVLGSPEFQLR